MALDMIPILAPTPVYATGSAYRAGNINVVGFGTIEAASLLAGGLNNASGGQITLQTGGAVYAKSLVDRSTNLTTTAAFGTFSNDTGTGNTSGINLGGSITFLTGAVIMADATNTSNYTSSIRLNLVAGSPVPATIVVNNAASTSGSSGGIAILANDPAGITVAMASNTAASGNGGSVGLINAGGSISLNGGISTSSQLAGGNAGSIVIDASGALVGNASSDLNASATSTATPGSVTVGSAAGSVTVDSINVSGASSAGGTVALFGSDITLRGAVSGVSVNASSSGSSGGSIKIYPSAGDTFTVDYNNATPQPGTYAQILASGTAGGNVLFENSNLSSVLDITQGSQVNINASSAAGGTINLTAGQVKLDAGTMSASAWPNRQRWDNYDFRTCQHG